MKNHLTLIMTKILVPIFIISKYAIAIPVQNKNCSLLMQRDPPLPQWKLWPNLVSAHSKKYDHPLIGMHKAIGHIWKLQHPADCYKVKYVISEGWFQGFGSEIHGYGVALALAVESNRVFLQEGGFTWRYRNPHCIKQNLKGLECYYEPFSKCSIKDAMMALNRAKYGAKSYKIADAVKNTTDTWTEVEDKLLEEGVIKYSKSGNWGKIADTIPTKSDSQCHHRWFSKIEWLVKSRKGLEKHARDKLHEKINKVDANLYDHRTKHHGVITLNRITAVKRENGKLSFDIVHSEYSDTVIVLANELLFAEKNLVPQLFISEILNECTTLSKNHYFFWWRAIAATYMIRPNRKTLDLIDEHRDPALKSVNGRCVSTYVRHGDKVGLEMKYVGFNVYGKAALKMFSNKAIFPAVISTTNSSPIQKIFYYATEDKNVMHEAAQFGEKNNIVVRHSNLSLVLLDNNEVHWPRDLEKKLPANHEYEYFSYILHLSEILSCDAVICTIPSNFCRIIDELRTTVGGSANGFNADVSTETCQRVPCIRNFGLANYVEPVYDPEDRIW